MQTKTRTAVSKGKWGSSLRGASSVCTHPRAPWARLATGRGWREGWSPILVPLFTVNLPDPRQTREEIVGLSGERSRGSQNSPLLSVSTKPVLVLLSQAEAWLCSLLLSCLLRVTNKTWNPEKSTAKQILHQKPGNSAKIKAKEQSRFSPVFFKCQGEK